MFHSEVHQREWTLTCLTVFLRETRFSEFDLVLKCWPTNKERKPKPSWRLLFPQTDYAKPITPSLTPTQAAAVLTVSSRRHSRRAATGLLRTPNALWDELTAQAPSEDFRCDHVLPAKTGAWMKRWVRCEGWKWYTLPHLLSPSSQTNNPINRRWCIKFTWDVHSQGLIQMRPKTLGSWGLHAILDSRRKGCGRGVQKGLYRQFTGGWEGAGMWQTNSCWATQNGGGTAGTQPAGPAWIPPVCHPEF